VADARAEHRRVRKRRDRILVNRCGHQQREPNRECAEAHHLGVTARSTLRTELAKAPTLRSSKPMLPR